MNNLLVIGGFTESRALLEPVANEAVEQGFGDDAKVLTLVEAAKMDDEERRAAALGMHVMTHSGGIAMVPEEVSGDLIVIAGTEPRAPMNLRSAAMQKTRNHLSGETSYPREDHRRIVRSNAAEFLAHIPTNMSLIQKISRFSTMTELGMKRIQVGGRTGIFRMEDDEFFGDTDYRFYTVFHGLKRARGMVYDSSVTAELPGGHDELLLNPRGVLNAINQTFDLAGCSR